MKYNAIWFASYPKSGNTWIHSVLRLAGKDYGFPQKDMDVYNLIRNGDGLTACAAVADRFKENPCVALKTHSVFKPNQPMHRFPDTDLVNAAYIHIYRNPLDVLLSYVNFTRLEYKHHEHNPDYKQRLFIDLLGMGRIYEYIEWLEMTLDTIPQHNLDHALRMFSENNFVLPNLLNMAGSWIENTESWLGAAENLPGYSIRYEDCLDNPEEIARLSDFFIFSKEEILSALNAVNNRARSCATEGNKDQAVFYNKMRAYYFRDYFSRDAVNRFLYKHEDVIKQLGYQALFNIA